MYDDLDAVAVTLHTIASDKGFWDNYYVSPDEFICTKLALIHSEVTEVLEAIRKNKSEQEVVEEFADILIRTLDLFAGMNQLWFKEDHSIGEVMKQKTLKNLNRPTLHGNKF